MTISLRQIMILVALACIWLAAIARGHHLAGAGGAAIFSVFGTCGVYAIGYSLLRKTEFRWRLAAIAGWMIAAGVVVFPYVVWADYWHAAGIREMQVKTFVVQQKLSSDPRFEGLSLTYVSSWNRRGQWLEVTGTLPSEDAFQAARQRLEAAADWHIEYDVSVLDR